MNIEVDISDLIALDSRLSGAGPIFQRHLLRGVDRAGKLIEGGAKGIAPVVTGNYRRNITSRATPIAGGAQATIRAGAPYSEIVEKGRGAIVAGPGRVLRFTIGGQVFYRKRVGPAKGGWYMRRTLNTHRAGAIRLVQQAGRDAAAEVIGGLA